MGRREDNKAAKRARLLQEGARLFAEQGFERTSIEQIAAAADVARGTFYLYYPDREALFGDLLDGFFLPLLARLSEAHATLAQASTRDETRAIYDDVGRDVAALALSHATLVQLAFQEQRAPGGPGDVVRAREARLVDVVADLTRVAADRGLIDAPLPRVGALIVLGAVERLFDEVLSGRLDADPLAVAAEVVRLLSRGLGATVG